MIGIYKITSPSGKIYIGSSKNINRRIKYYKSLSCKGQSRLFNSIKKYGWDNHLFEIIEECLFEDLYRRETFYGLQFNVLDDRGLNCVLPKFNENKLHVSEDTRLKMSNSKKGIKNTFYGKNHSLEARIKISNTHKGRVCTEEHKLKVSLNNARNNAKIVIDLNTGVFYSSCKEAALYNNMNHSTLKSQLNGNNPNKTNLRYC